MVGEAARGEPTPATEWVFGMQAITVINIAVETQRPIAAHAA